MYSPTCAWRKAHPNNPNAADRTLASHWQPGVGALIVNGRVIRFNLSIFCLKRPRVQVKFGEKKRDSRPSWLLPAFSVWQSAALRCYCCFCKRSGDSIKFPHSFSSSCSRPINFCAIACICGWVLSRYCLPSSASRCQWCQLSTVTADYLPFSRRRRLCVSLSLLEIGDDELRCVYHFWLILYMSAILGLDSRRASLRWMGSSNSWSSGILVLVCSAHAYRRCLVTRNRQTADISCIFWKKEVQFTSQHNGSSRVPDFTFSRHPPGLQRAIDWLRYYSILDLSRQRIEFVARYVQ